MLHTTGPETTATDDDPNSEHYQYIARRDSEAWPHLPLEIPTLLLGRTAVAGHIRGFVQASFSRAVDISRTARVNFRNIIEGVPPEGILSRYCDMFKEKEDATHIRAAEVMRELGWDATG